MALPAQQPAPAGAVRVRKGTLLKLEMLRQLDPATAQPGDDVPFRLSRPLYVEGVTLLPAGELLHGVVTRVRKVNPKCRTGEVAWKLERITFADSSSVRVRAGFQSWRPNDHVPEKSPPEHGDRPCNDSGCANRVALDVVLTPFLAAGIVEYGAIQLIKKPFRGNGCSRISRGIPLPAHSTVALEITEDHTVRY